MLGNRSLHDQLATAGSISPQVITNGTINGASVNLTTRQSQAHGFVIELGDYTDGTHTFTFEESSDDSTFTAIVAANLDGFDFLNSQELFATGLASVVVSDATRDGQRLLIGYVGINEYIRAVCVTTGATTGLVAGAGTIQGNMRYQGNNPGITSAF